MSKKEALSTIPISDAEAQVMEVLWAHAGMSTEEIAAALSSRQTWQLSAIKTLLNRLLKKGAVRAEPDGRRYLYTAVLKRNAWQRTESTSLIDRVFGGSLAPLVAHFSQQRKLSAHDITALKELLTEYEKRGKRD
jgi:BlaI family transcriptional regulator, penicillinase repressor